MKLILNPTKSIYINRETRKIRCGNFPENGKEIEYEEEKFVDIFIKMKTPIEKQDLENIASSKFDINKDDFNNAIDFLIKEKIILTDKEYKKLISSERYNRQDMYFYMLSDNLKTVRKIKNKKILILGIGGIGSIVAELLVRAGFENITIVDDDKVEISNLIRQSAYYSKDIGKLKIDALSKRIKKINGNCNIVTLNKKITSKNDIYKSIKNTDFVICTLDKPIRIIRRLINKICIKEKKPVLFLGFSEHVGMIGPFVIPYKTACLECINHATEEKNIGNVKTAPSFGPLCNLIASIATSEIINYFINYKEDNLRGYTMMFNMCDYSTKKIRWQKQKKCRICGDKNDNSKII